MDHLFVHCRTTKILWNKLHIAKLEQTMQWQVLNLYACLYAQSRQQIGDISIPSMHWWRSSGLFDWKLETTAFSAMYKEAT